MDHVEAVVLTDVSGHFGHPNPLPILHVKGSHAAHGVTGVHLPLVDHRRVHEICRHANVLPQQLSVFVELAHAIGAGEVHVQVIVYGCSIGQCMKTSFWVMPRPRKGIIDTKRGIVLGHREERKTSATTGPMILFFPLPPVSSAKIYCWENHSHERLHIARPLQTPGQMSAPAQHNGT